MIKAVIFDCFGVLSQGSLDYLSSLASPESRAEVRAISYRSDYGHISHQEYLDEMSVLVGLSPNEIKQIFEKQHVRNEPLVEFVKQLRKQYKTALLSNIGRDMMSTLFSAEEQAALFDTVVLSSDIGMVKPYPEIYELTATRLAVAPEECVMIDDILRNVEGAEAVGMKGLQYISNEQVMSELKNVLEQGNA